MAGGGGVEQRHRMVDDPLPQPRRVEQRGQHALGGIGREQHEPVACTRLRRVPVQAADLSAELDGLLAFPDRVEVGAQVGAERRRPLVRVVTPRGSEFTAGPSAHRPHVSRAQARHRVGRTHVPQDRHATGEQVHAYRPLPASGWPVLLLSVISTVR